MKFKPLIQSALIITTMLTILQPYSANADSGLQPYGAVHQTWIEPSPNNPGAEFSNAIAMDGDTLVVGARHDSVTVGVDAVYYAGAVYVYVLDENIWTLQARLGASDAEAYDLFGSSVDIDGDTLIVGAVGSDSTDENDEAAPDMGAAYVFTRSGDQWQQEAKIEPEDGIADDNFGNAVSINGERIVVGASAKDIGNTKYAGKVYSYYRSGKKWYQSQSVTAPKISRESFFGSSIDYDGQRLVVGAQSTSDTGAAYIFYRIGSTWTQEAAIEAAKDHSGDNFGASVSIDGETIVVGAPFTDPDLGGGEITNAGAVYVFHKKANSWKQEARLVLDDAVAFDQFGQSVIINDTTIVAGATAQDYYNILRSGSAYVYERNTGEWELQTRIISGEPYMDGDFGASLAIDGKLIAVGEPGTSTQNQAGIVHIYSLEAGILPETGFTPGIQVDTTIQRKEIKANNSLQIEIPQLVLQTQIVGVSQQGNSWNVNWLTTAVGHLEGTAYPTHLGNSVIAGHINLPDGTSGPFANIGQLQWGDEISLSLDGVEYTYEVREVYQTTPDDLDVLERSNDYAWLTLVTCSEYDITNQAYQYRTIIVAIMVE